MRLTNYFKSSCLLVVGLVLPYAAAQEAAPPTHVAHAGLKKLNWQLACRGSTFHAITTFEMIDLLHSLNFHHIELSPGQSLSPDNSDVKIGGAMTVDQVTMLNAKLKSVGLDIVSFGPVDLPSSEADLGQLFDFGKRLKLKNIVIADPADESFELLDKLAGEHSINVAIFHPVQKTRGWDVDATLKAMAGRSPRLGVCANIGDWRRTGLDPVETAAKLKGRVIEVHLEDFDAENQDQPLGSGTADLAPILKSFKDQNFKGVFSISYESGSGAELLGHFVTSVNWLSDRVNELADIH